MTCRQAQTLPKNDLPRVWLMTDARFGDRLLRAVKALPFGSAVIFRHYALPNSQRRKLFLAVRTACRQRGHKLFLGGDERTALKWRADGFHARSGRRTSALLRSAPVHNRHELQEALRNGVDLLFISALFATASHPDRRALGRLAFNRLASRKAHAHVIALGGMNRQRASSLDRKHVHGWAAIDAFRK
ncbi:MAG: thiamine phosphate synthase [Sphingorhabdus sp.]